MSKINIIKTSIFLFLFVLVSPLSFSQKIVQDNVNENGQRVITADYTFFGKYIEASGPIAVALQCISEEGKSPEFRILIRYKYLFPQTIKKGSALKMNLQSDNSTITIISDRDVSREDLNKWVRDEVAIPTANGTWYIGTAYYYITEDEIKQIINNTVKNLYFSEEAFVVSGVFTDGIEGSYKKILKCLNKKTKH